MLGAWGESIEMIGINDLSNLWCLIQMCDGIGINQESCCQKVLSIAEYRTWDTQNIKHRSFGVFSCVLFTEVQMREKMIPEI